MPTYLVHGFRWPRAAIRIHIILYDLEDAAAEWIIAPASAITILNSFYTLFDFLPPSQPPVTTGPPSIPGSPDINAPLSPNSKNGPTLGSGGGGGAGSRKGGATEKKAKNFNDWSIVKLFEHYDPDDESCTSQPYAYVADYMVPVTLSLDVGAEMAAYEEKQRAETQPLLSPGAASLRRDSLPLLSPPLASPSSDAAASSNGTSGTTAQSMSEREMRRKSRRLGWFEKLRDQLAKGESIGWYVVVCGDEERSVPDLEGLKIRVEKGADNELRPKTPRSAGLRGFFGRKERSSKGTEDK